MAFCTYSREYARGAYTDVENAFIDGYLADATGEAIKVYLYGLSLCARGGEFGLKEAAEALRMDAAAVKDAFLFWEECGLVDILSDEPFLVQYLPVSVGKPRKYRPEKYGDFCTSVQKLLPSRMISVNEYAEYFSLMETYRMRPEALLLVVKYCADIKGRDIGYRYISTVAKNFASRGLLTAEAVEKELEGYVLRSSEIAEVLRALGARRNPDPEDSALYRKWTEELGFDAALVIHAARKVKRGGMAGLDAMMNELYAAKRFSAPEADDFLKKKQATYDLAKKINRTLSLYYETLDNLVETYLSPWLAKGYEEQALLLLAQYCFRRGKRSYEALDELISSLYEKGLVDLGSIAEYMRELAEDDAFLKKFLAAAGVSRRPTEWDRENLRRWREWNFSDEMIELAATYAAGKNGPIPYVNSVLSNWKAQGVFSPDRVSAAPQAQKKKSAGKFAAERVYTEEELAALVTSVDDIEI